MVSQNKNIIFQTPIWGFIIGDQRYQSKDYIDAILDLERTEPSVKKSNIGGYQTHDNLHAVPVFKEFCDMIENIGTSCFEESNGIRGKAKITEMWGNINYPNCHNAAHTHGEALSGVFYLQVPDSSGNLVLCNPAVRADGRLFRPSNFPITPKPLACIMFPSWLEHYVEPNLSSSNRISISFNMRIES